MGRVTRGMAQVIGVQALVTTTGPVQSRSMPELPEIEVLRRSLEPHLVGDTIERSLVRDPRLAHLFDVEVQSPYSYWFVCRPMDLENRPVRIFHEWLVGAGL